MHENTIGTIVVHVPIWAVYVTGIGAALYHHRRLKLQATLVLVAFLMAFVASVTDVARMNWYLTAIERGGSQAEAALVLGVVRMFTTLVHSGAMLLLVYAIFWGRD